MSQVTIESLDRLPNKTGKEHVMCKNVRDRLEKYPYAVKTLGTIVPNPTIVHKTLDCGDFFRQPFPRAKETVWLFDCEQARDTFLNIYVGEPLTYSQEGADDSST